MKRQALLFTLLATTLGNALAGERGSLYARLGGNSAVRAFVNDSVDRAALQPRAALDDADLARVKTQLAQRICALTGGGCKSPQDHPQFAPFVETLRVSMRDHAVPLAARNELLEILVPVRRDLARR